MSPFIIGMAKLVVATVVLGLAVLVVAACVFALMFVVPLYAPMLFERKTVTSVKNEYSSEDK